MKILFLFFILVPRSFAQDQQLPTAPENGRQVRYQANHVEYNLDKSTLHLNGNVTLKSSTITVTGDDLWVDTEHRQGRSDAPIRIEDGVSVASGQSGEFNFEKQTGYLTQSSGSMGDWSVFARRAYLNTNHRLDYYGANFTSCNNVPSHYHFSALSVHVVPKKYFFAENALFYLGKVPVFYTPFLFKSLNPDQSWQVKFQEGVDRRNGPYVKGTLISEVVPSIRSKLFLDYYSKMGYGYGGEFDHDSGPDSRGALFAYRIRESGTVNERWGFFGGGYKKFAKGTALQSRLQIQSDSQFTNNYVRSDVFRLTPELINNVALTQTFSGGNLRILYQRNDVQSPLSEKKFVKNTESTPRVEYQSPSIRFFNLPWINSFNGFADNSYDRSRSYMLRTVNLGWDGTKSFQLMRGLSFTPRMAYQHTYYNRFDETMTGIGNVSRYDAFIGRWTASGNVRLSSIIGNIDATHTYTKRLQSRSFAEDNGPQDRGVENNSLTLSDVFVPTYRTWARIATGYNFTNYRDNYPTFNQRIQPITTDLGWQTTKTTNVTIHNQYQLATGKGKNNSVIADVNWDPGKLVSVRGGLAYNLTTPGTYYQSVDFVISPSTMSWKVAFSLRSVVTSEGGVQRAHSFHLFEKEISWSQRWHDFFTQFSIRIRPGNVTEGTARIELRFGDADPKHAKQKQSDKDWFPSSTSHGSERPD